MRARTVLASVLVGALAVLSSTADAAPKSMDGKKVKKLSITANGGAQDHDQDFADLESADRTECAMPRCARLPFVYKPVKGVNGDMLFSLKWTNPLSDIDLYVGEVAKDGSTSEVAHCAGFGTATEKVFLPKSELKPGRTYVLVIDFFRSLNETVTGTVEMGAANSIRTTVPAAADGQIQNINCTQ